MLITLLPIGIGISAARATYINGRSVWQTASYFERVGLGIIGYSALTDNTILSTTLPVSGPIKTGLSWRETYLQWNE